MRSPLLAPRLSARSLAFQAAAIAVGTLFLAVSSWISVPMVPVPMTMQTLAVTLVGALFGWRLGAVTVLAWLGEAAAGLPVLSEFKAGLLPFVGPTAGYLAAFPVAAALVGWLTERGWTSPVKAGVSMLLGNAVILAMGFAWLATMIGPGKALAFGVTPFLLGGVLKAALGAAAVVAMPRRPV